jgi:CTP:molybdopterin cytidylyltransferase MocA
MRATMTPARTADRADRGRALAAIVLAAGEGHRFGGPKQLAELDGRPLIAHVVAAALGHRTIDRVVVVLGARADAIRRVVPVDDRVRTVLCADWADGPRASLRRGLSALDGADALVLLADQPRIPAAAIDRVLAADAALVRATVDGTPGHPVLIRADQQDRVARLDDDGRRALLRAEAVAVEIGDLGGTIDVDRPDDLARLRAP